MAMVALASTSPGKLVEEDASPRSDGDWRDPAAAARAAASAASPMSSASMVTLPLDDDSDEEDEGAARPQVLGSTTPGARSVGSSLGASVRRLAFGAAAAAAMPPTPLSSKKAVALPAGAASPSCPVSAADGAEAAAAAAQSQRSRPLPLVRSPLGGRDDEKESFFDQEALSEQETRWALALIGFSGLDLLASACLAGFSFSYATRYGADSLLCLGMQALSHLFSSFVLTVRFMSEQVAAFKRKPDEEQGSPEAASEGCLLYEQRRRDRRREQAFAVTMGLAMLVSCGGLLFKALRKMRYWESWDLDHDAHNREVQAFTDVAAWWGFGGYLIQACLRFAAARRLRMSIAWHGFAVSVVSLLFFLVLGIAASLQKEWSWKAEPIAAMVLVCIMLCESVRMLVLNMSDVDVALSQDTRA